MSGYVLISSPWLVCKISIVLAIGKAAGGGATG